MSTRRPAHGWLVPAAAVLLALPALGKSAAAAETCEAPSAKVATAAGGGAAAQLARGNELESAGAHAEALVAYDESRRLAQERGETSLAILADANAARAAVEAGQLAGVEERLARVLSAVDSLPEPAARAQLLIHAGRSYSLLSERSPEARNRAARAAADALGRAGEAAQAAADERLRSFALGYLGELYERAERRDDALQLTRRAIYAAHQADAPDALYRWQWQLGRIERSRGNDESALDAYRDAVTSLRDIRTQSALAVDEQGTFKSRVEPIYLELVDLLLTRVDRVTAADERQRTLAEVRDALEDLKSSELRDYFRDPCLDAQRKAAPDTIPNTVVVYPVLLPDRTELIVSRGGQLERYRLPQSREELTAEVRQFRRMLEKRTSRSYLPHARRLYDWLIRPIEPTLEAGDEPVTLVIVPDGALRTIPFAALRDEKTKQFLIEKYPIAVAPSLTLTDPRPIESDDVRLLAAGISDAVEGYPELQAVVDEIEAIREIYPGRTLMNDGFAVAELESALTSSPFGIVHIASHGEFGGNSADSFLLAYDGRVSMDHLAATVGATRFRTDQPLELLTLSACMSAAGDDRAALGLAGVAVRSGARSALASLWMVNDQATAELVIDFYRQLSKPEVSRAKALQVAQVTMLSTRHYRHPGYWAPFLLINSWL